MNLKCWKASICVFIVVIFHLNSSIKRNAMALMLFIFITNGLKINIIFFLKNPSVVIWLLVFEISSFHRHTNACLTRWKILTHRVKCHCWNHNFLLCYFSRYKAKIIYSEHRFTVHKQEKTNYATYNENLFKWQFLGWKISDHTHIYWEICFPFESLYLKHPRYD